VREPYDAAADVERRADRQLRVIGVLFAIDLVLIVGIILAALFWPGNAAAQIPRDALQYRADLTRQARLAWGLNAPIADFAAQIHQESHWRPDAVSRAGAVGMAQFMPSTARWWCELHRLSARECQPEHPTWAIRALVGYDRWLWDRIHNTASDCDRMALTLSAYNGGLGWVQRDRALASSKGLDAGRYWDAVETVNAGRAAWAIKENRGYPLRILRALALRYASWGQSACN
jgi:soluble lytic murein transglycosylase-like protein